MATNKIAVDERRRCLRIMGVPEIYRHAKLNFDLPSMDNIKKLILSDGNVANTNLIVTAPVGTGKTYLIAGILSEIANMEVKAWDRRFKNEKLYKIDGHYAYLKSNGDSGTIREYSSCDNHFTKESDLLINILEAKSQGGYSGVKEALYPILGGETDKPFRIFQTPPILIIDDFGATVVDEFKRETMARIVNHRYENSLPIYITTNHSIDELVDIYDDRIVSRLLEHCLVVKLGGKDRRLHKEQKSVEYFLEYVTPGKKKKPPTKVVKT